MVSFCVSDVNELLGATRVCGRLQLLFTLTVVLKHNHGR